MPFPISIESAEGKKFEFVEINAVNSWLLGERDTWSRFASDLNTIGACEATQKAIEIHAELTAQYREFESIKGSQGVQPDRIERFIAGITSWIRGPWVTSSRAVQLFEHIWTTYGPVVLRGCMEAFIEGEKDRARFAGNPQQQELAGRILAILLKERVPHDADYQAVRAMEDAYTAKLNNCLEGGQRLFSEKAGQLKDLAGEWNAKQDQYLQIKEFDAAAEYWARKRWWHRVAAGLLAFLIIFVAIRGICLVLKFNQEARDDLEKVIATESSAHAQMAPAQQAAAPPPSSTGERAKTGDSALDAWRIALLLRESFPTLVLAVALFWLLRILVRIFLTQLHQWSDASERVVMVNTYLAMHVGAGILEGKSAVDEKARTIVLSQIFRHGISGLYRDDAAPTTPLTVLTGAKSPEKPASE